LKFEGSNIDFSNFSPDSIFEILFAPNIEGKIPTPLQPKLY